MPPSLTLRLSPSGRLWLDTDPEAPALDAALADGIDAAFTHGPGEGLLHLGGAHPSTVLPPVLGWWRDLGVRYFTRVCTRPDTGGGWIALPPPSDDDLDALVAAAPPMRGAEYLSPDALRALWAALDAAFAAELSHGSRTVQGVLGERSPVWNVVGRVHFNLAENRNDPDAPFAFLATYTPQLSAHGKAQHRPLGQALRDGAADKAQLLSLLLPVQRAAAGCAWLKVLVESGQIFHPLRWTPQDALRLLGDVATLERAGVVVRLPAAWKAGRPARPRVTATVGSQAPAGLGQEALLDFQVALSLEGEALSADEIKALLAGTGGLAYLRGQWVEVDPDRLRRTMSAFEAAQRLAARDGLGFAEAMRLVAGANLSEDGVATEADPSWAGVVAGPWLAQTLRSLRAPGGLPAEAQPPGLRGTLRPYQQVGVRWLQLVAGLGLGACLADDMGLGKTIQILALLLGRRRMSGERRPSLLVVPASLLGNWAAEIARFAPELAAKVAHGSAMSAEALAALTARDLEQTDLVITTYGALLRLDWPGAIQWDLVLFDEAQALKNPGAKQTRAARRLKARARVALTGTPIENRLGDLWSIFDVINPGLLGSARQFTSYTRKLAAQQGQRHSNPYGPLRELVGPYILRRLKTDRSVITDLPDKTEMAAYCQLSRKQAALYQAAVDELAGLLDRAEGMARRGLVLAFLTRLKQICNHPSQWLGDGSWAPEQSGKWARLREITEVVAERQDKMLVFTQFTEVIPPLAAYLGGIFGRPGLVLQGDTPVRKRPELVARFQEDEQVPFLLLSLKAGGAGLNLTAASHVVHFDRWWNPAVEDQATDRAYRIGQARNVLVHKFVCKGTVEDRIDALIATKRQLSKDILEGGGEVSLTELDDAALLRLVSLDLSAALQE